MSGLDLLLDCSGVCGVEHENHPTDLISFRVYELVDNRFCLFAYIFSHNFPFYVVRVDKMCCVIYT